MQPRCSPLFVSLNPSVLAKIGVSSRIRHRTRRKGARCSLVGAVLMRCCRGSRSEDVPSEMANHA